AVADQRRHVTRRRGDDLSHYRVRLRVHRGRVQRVVTTGDPEEAGALLEGLRAEPGNPLEAGTRTERAVRVTVRHDVLGQPGGDAGDPGKQRHGRGVQVHTDAVHAVFHDADGLRVDLDQLGQGVLQAAGDRDRTPQRDVHPRQLL